MKDNTGIHCSISSLNLQTFQPIVTQSRGGFPFTIQPSLSSATLDLHFSDNSLCSLLCSLLCTVTSADRSIDVLKLLKNCQYIPSPYTLHFPCATHLHNVKKSKQVQRRREERKREVNINPVDSRTGRVSFLCSEQNRA